MVLLEAAQVLFSTMVLIMAAWSIPKTYGLLYDASAFNVVLATITIFTNLLLIYLFKFRLKRATKSSKSRIVPAPLVIILKAVTILLPILWFAAFITIFIAGSKSGDGFKFGKDENDRGDYVNAGDYDGSAASRALAGYGGVTETNGAVACCGPARTWRSWGVGDASSSTSTTGAYYGGAFTTSAPSTFVTSTSEYPFRSVGDSSGRAKRGHGDTMTDILEGRQDLVGSVMRTVNGKIIAARHWLNSIGKTAGDIAEKGIPEVMKETFKAIQGLSYACGVFGIFLFILTCIEAGQVFTADWGSSTRNAESKSLISEGGEIKPGNNGADGNEHDGRENSVVTA